MKTQNITIDTNSINVKRADVALNQLEEWHRRGLIEITRTRVLAEELGRDATRYGPARRRKAQTYREGTSAFVMRRSRLRGGDALRAPDAYVWVEPITEMLHPGRNFSSLDKADQGDVLHLAIHRAHQWNFFVTRDRSILEKARELWERLEIKVVTPEEAADSIRPSIEPPP